MAGEPANGVGFGEEMNSTVCRSVKSWSFASLAIFSAWVRKPRSAYDQGLLRERRVQVVLAEVVPGERAAELGQRRGRSPGRLAAGRARSRGPRRRCRRRRPAMPGMTTRWSGSRPLAAARALMSL